jgi:membrane associated rhomboid family serine protease
MGFEDRDYNQYDPSWQTSWGQDTPSTKRLLIITVVVFVLQTLLTREAGLDSVMRFGARRVSFVDEWAMLDAQATLSGQVWRVLTYAFCHDRQSPLSLVFNMVGLWFLGRRLERMYGSREFLLFYLTAAISAGALFTAFGIAGPLPLPLSGAYPPVLALFALYATHFPREEILFFWLIPVQIRILILVIVGLDLYTLLQAAQGEIGLPIAAMTSAHLWGVAFGYLYRHFDWHLSGMWNQINPARWRTAWRRASASRRLRVYAPSVEVEPLEEKVDAILAKIHEHGSDSLTDTERAILAKASERYKNRT